MNQKGFTLPEVIATMAIAGILLAVAVPNFRELIRENRLASQANSLVSAINLTRSEAIKRGTRVTLCKSNDGTQCSGIGTYEQGWIIFSDANNPVGRVDNNDKIVRIFTKLPNTMTLIGNGNIDSYISYTADGVARFANNAFQAGTLQLCQENHGRNIILSAGGRVRVETPPNC